MLSLLLLVFAPVIVAGVALAALLAGAATVGAWESMEERREQRPAAAGATFQQVAREEGIHVRAA